MARKKKEEPPRGTPAWMTTFGDMNSLLLTFFVMLIAQMSTNKSDSVMKVILSAFNDSLGNLAGGMTLSPGKLIEGGNTLELMPSREPGKSLGPQVKQLADLLKPELKSRKVRIDETQKGYKISLASDVFFKPGSAEIDYPEGIEIIKKVAMMLKELNKDYKIEVIGHTDAGIIKAGTDLSSKYPTNWELSTARASTVVRLLESFGVMPEIMYAEGRSQYDPIESNDTPEGRAYNRRIDIYVSPAENY